MDFDSLLSTVSVYTYSKETYRSLQSSYKVRKIVHRRLWCYHEVRWIHGIPYTGGCFFVNSIGYGVADNRYWPIIDKLRYTTLVWRLGDGDREEFGRLSMDAVVV